ncbi:HNH endonuclease [Edwardsiella tarda]|uniref:HNH endonuclease n=1 Tax=Edwardsiella tarda TaxID=636 RepID=UPI0039BDCE79
MNKINRIRFTDSTAIKELTSNKKLKFHNDIKDSFDLLMAAYKEYIITSGIPDKSNYPSLAKPATDALKIYYESPPKAISAINDIRSKNSNSLCPMCGSMHSGTLDHVLPKEVYPEFSVFSRNLVPACKCNIIKGRKTSNSLGARILHPYYDKILAERLISAKFTSLSQYPKIDIDILLSPTHPLYSSVVFHTNEIVKKNKIIGYLSEQWESFYLYPESVIRGLTPRISDISTYIELIKKEILLLDMKHKGKNNWNSVFASGLANNEVGRWIITELQSPDRTSDGMLNT